MTKYVYVLTDIHTCGGTETWMINFCKILDEMYVEYITMRDHHTNFNRDSIIIINNYYHKIFNEIQPELLNTLKIYFVMHGQTNPGNSYLVDNLEYFNGIICVSNKIFKFAQKKIPTNKLEFYVLENFVEPIEPIEPIKQNTTIFNFVGRISPEKNLPMLLYAFDKLNYLNNNYNNWTLNIWGDTSNVRHYDLLINIINKLGIKNNVKFCGFTDVKTNLYTNCSYIILPSVVEGSSYAVLEALAHGVPIIACKNVGDNDFQILEGSNGYLINLETNNLIDDELANINFNLLLKNIGYIEGIIYKNIKNNNITLNRNAIPLPPIFYNIHNEKSRLFQSNVNIMAKTLKYAIDNKLQILPQTRINKDLFLQTVKNILNS